MNIIHEKLSLQLTLCSIHVGYYILVTSHNSQLYNCMYLRNRLCPLDETNSS